MLSMVTTTCTVLVRLWHTFSLLFCLI